MTAAGRTDLAAPLEVLSALPPGFLRTEWTQIADVTGPLSLYHLRGGAEPALFVSVMLHGNEPAGLRAVQEVIASYGGRLPRSLLLLVGNTDAAREKMRHLEGQPDFNRIWVDEDVPENRRAMQVLDAVRARGFFAAIDIHNNTGRNPYFSGIFQFAPRTVQLASRFSRHVVHARAPKGMLGEALAGLGPSVTIECGPPTDDDGVREAVRIVRHCLEIAELPLEMPRAVDVDLLETVAVVKITGGAAITFNENRAEHFPADLDAHNFTEVDEGFCMAIGDGAFFDSFRAYDPYGADVTHRYFRYDSGRIRTARPLVPCMLTLDVDVIRKDCLCYVMERRALGPA